MLLQLGNLDARDGGTPMGAPTDGQKSHVKQDAESRLLIHFFPCAQAATHRPCGFTTAPLCRLLAWRENTSSIGILVWDWIPHSGWESARAFSGFGALALACALVRDRWTRVLEP